MSQSQQQPHKQEAGTACTNKKRRNRGKRSQRKKSSFNCKPNEIHGAAGDSKMVAEENPLHNSMEQLKMARELTATSRIDAGSNWEAVARLSQQQSKQKTYEQEDSDAKAEENHSEGSILGKSARRRRNRRAAEEKYVAMDCEMVGVGPYGQYDMLARVSIVSKSGKVLLDKFVKPKKTVTDYRTSVSGIRPHDINSGEDFKSVQDEVVQILQGKILVGHSICNDLAVLHLRHPQSNIRDTARYKPLCRIVANGRTPSLKRLTQAILGKEIQTGEHNSVEDARAAMSIYNKLASNWEAYIKKHQPKIGK